MPSVRALGQGVRVQRSVTRLCWLHGLREFGLLLHPQHPPVPRGDSQTWDPLLQAFPLEHQAPDSCRELPGTSGDSVRSDGAQQCPSSLGSEFCSLVRAAFPTS